MRGLVLCLLAGLSALTAWPAMAKICPGGIVLRGADGRVFTPSAYGEGELRYTAHPLVHVLKIYRGTMAGRTVHVIERAEKGRSTDEWRSTVSLSLDEFRFSANRNPTFWLAQEVRWRQMREAVLQERKVEITDGPLAGSWTVACR